jgi:hypothetical protein
MQRMPTKAELRAARLAKIASSMRDFTSLEGDESNLEESNLQEYNLPSKLWNLGDLFDDVVPPMEAPDDTTYHQPQPFRETRRPVFRTVQDTRPPRGVKR